MIAEEEEEDEEVERDSPATGYNSAPRPVAPAPAASRPHFKPTSAIVLYNSFSCLSDLDPEFKLPHVLTGPRGKAFARVAAELHTFYSAKSRRKTLPTQASAKPEQAAKPSDIKVLIYDFVESVLSKTWDATTPLVDLPYLLKAPQDAFWSRVSLSRLKFKGDKRTYIRVLVPDGSHAAITLHVPRHGAEYSERHAERQATFNDDCNGVYAAGKRVNTDAMAEYGVDPTDIEFLRTGYPVGLKYWPKRYHGHHYGDAAAMSDKLQADLDRVHAGGFTEGPLHYTPHIVQGLGGVWKEDKQKWRTIVNGASSGVNEASEHYTTKYDMLHDVLAKLRPGTRMSGCDLTDAFLNCRGPCRAVGKARN